VSEVLEHLFSRTGYLGTVQASFAGRQQRANLEQLLELARGLEGSGRVSLREFVQLMEELAVRGPREEPAATIEEAGEAIRLMTIHQAKGLEFPIVCVADLGRGQGGRRRSLLIHGELGFAAKLKTWGEDGDENGSAGESLPWRLLRWQEGVETEAESERLLYVAATRARDYLVLSGPWYEPADRRVARGWMGWLRAGLPEDVSLPEPGEEATVPFHGVNAHLRQGVETDEAVLRVGVQAKLEAVSFVLRGGITVRRQNVRLACARPRSFQAKFELRSQGDDGVEIRRVFVRVDQSVRWNCARRLFPLIFLGGAEG